MCGRDLLFFLNAFAWTYDPRADEGKKELPFITYPFQDDALLTINDTILEKRDALVEKTRDMGASWMFLYVYGWRFMFKAMETFLLISRVEDLVDKRGDPDSLFWKLLYFMDKLPSWLKPKYHRAKLHVANLETGSTIDGASTTSESGRGGRRTAILPDEFAANPEARQVLAAIQDNSPTNHFNSTPRGTANGFYEQRQRMIEAGDCVMSMWWPFHTEKARGLYEGRNGAVTIHDQDYRFADDYPFVLDGKVRSPWYDREFRRRGKMLVAQELDIDYLASDFTFFDFDILKGVEKEMVRDPFAEGYLEYVHQEVKPVGFRAREDGPLKLWILPDENGRLPKDTDYIVTADIAEGTGASNSCLGIGDLKLKKLIGEYANPNIRPGPFADLAVATCRWLVGRTGRGAHLMWEANGPGRAFGTRVIELGYNDIYMREQLEKISGKRTDFPGWWSTKENKNDALEQLQRALGGREFEMRSYAALREYMAYIYAMKGQKVIHGKALDDTDPSGAEENHGDRVITHMLMWHAMRTKKTVRHDDATPKYPHHSYAGRRERRRAQEKAQKYRY